MDVRLADKMKYVVDPFFELTKMPFSLLDIPGVSKELRKAFDIVLDIKITGKEATIALLLASGFSYEYIAKLTKTGKDTVTNHKTSIFSKIHKLHTPETLAMFDPRIFLVLLVNRLLNQLK